MNLSVVEMSSVDCDNCMVSTYRRDYELPRFWNAKLHQMSETEVFRPSDGPLFVRGNLSNGLSNSADVFRKRPSTQGSRFGKKTVNSFFTRHNPHPGRVRHIKGLLDIPICAVNDNGYLSNPRYSLQFPPNSADSNKLRNSMVDNLPANLINVNSQQHPINTITGLQYFCGKPLNFRVFRDRGLPKMNIAPSSEAWKDELRALTDAIGVANNNLPKLPEHAKPMTADRPATRKCQTADGIRPRTSQYSSATGRLIPPPSRAMSRGSSRGRSPLDQLDILQTGESDMEAMVLQMLCQILQTDDPSSVQSWLVAANDREKALVLDMLKSALSTNEDYYKKAFADERRGQYTLPNIGVEKDVTGQIIGDENSELGKRIDRLSLMGDDPPPRAASQMSHEFNIEKSRVTPPKTITEEDEDIVKPHLNEVFDCKKRLNTGRPRTGTRSKTPSPPSTPIEAKFKYTAATPLPNTDKHCTHITEDERVQ